MLQKAQQFFSLHFITSENTMNQTCSYNNYHQKIFYDEPLLKKKIYFCFSLQYSTVYSSMTWANTTSAQYLVKLKPNTKFN